MTKLKAQIELKQEADYYTLSIHSPSIQKQIRLLAETKHKYTNFGYIHRVDDIPLNEYMEENSFLILSNGKPNLFPLLLRNSKINKMKIYFNNIKKGDLEEFSKNVNSQVLDFYNYIITDKHKFTFEWLEKALDYYFEKGFFDSKVEVNTHSLKDLLFFLQTQENKIKTNPQFKGVLKYD